LKLGPARILVDCGWDCHFKESSLTKLKDAVLNQDEPINLILLSFGDLEHVGALPVVVGRLGLRVPIYCTFPTLSIGYQTLYEAHECHPNSSAHNSSSSAAAAVAAVAAADAADAAETGDGTGAPSTAAGGGSGGFQAFTLDHVDEAFATMDHSNSRRPHGIRPLKYNETLVISDMDLTITPINAGRGLGGALWRFRWQTDEILYAVDLNPLNELHLNKSAHEQVSRPSLLITDSTNWGRATLTGGKTPKARQEEVRKLVLETLRQQGNVLLPSDAAGRSLELLLLLDSMWSEPQWQLPHYCRLIFLHSMARNVVTLARNMTEWMSDDISLRYDPLEHHPFDVAAPRGHVEVFHSVADFDQHKRRTGDNRPCVVLATHGSLEMGPGRDLLARWASDVRNRVIFTSRAPAGSQSARLQTATVRPLMVALTVWVKKLLEGRELEEWERQRQAERDEAQRASDRQRFIDEIRLGGIMVDEDGKSSVPTGEGAGAAMATEDFPTLPLEMRPLSSDLTPLTPGSLADGNDIAGGATRTESASLEIGLGRKLGSVVLGRARSSSFGGGVVGSALAKNISGSEVMSSTDVVPGGSSIGVGGGGRGKRRKITASSFMYYTTPRHVMFGALEPQVKQDVYGADIPEDVLGALRHIQRKSRGHLGTPSADLRDRMLKNSQGDSFNVGMGGDHGNGGGDDDDDAMADGESAPFKYVREKQSLTVQCSTPLVDLEGRPDAQALRNILSNLRPRRLVVAYGPGRASQELRAHGEKALGIEKKYCCAPANGTSVTLDLDSHSYDVLLHDRIVNRLRSQAVGNVPGIEVSHVQGIVQRPDPKLQAMRAPIGQRPRRLIAPPDDESAGGHLPVWIGAQELRILTVRKLLTDQAVDNVLRGQHPKQQLICGDLSDRSKQVVVRHNPRTKQLQLEGGLCHAYFVVRKAIYDSLTMV
jgi:Cft2 family RNA processing exonuclease